MNLSYIWMKLVFRIKERVFTYTAVAVKVVQSRLGT